MSRCDVPWNDPAYGGRNTFITVAVRKDPDDVFGALTQAVNPGMHHEAELGNQVGGKMKWFLVALAIAALVGMAIYVMNHDYSHFCMPTHDVSCYR